MGALEDFKLASEAAEAARALLERFAEGVPHGALTDDERLALTVTKHVVGAAKAAASLPGVDSHEFELATEMLATLVGMAEAVAGPLASLRKVRLRVERGALRIDPSVAVKVAGVFPGKGIE